MSVQRIKKIAQVVKKDCVACGSCIHVCPRKAIEVPKGIHAEVDHEKCVGCGICARICPASVIDILHQKKEEGILVEA